MRCTLRLLRHRIRGRRLQRPGGEAAGGQARGRLGIGQGGGLTDDRVRNLDDDLREGQPEPVSQPGDLVGGIGWQGLGDPGNLRGHRGPGGACTGLGGACAGG